MKMQKMTKTLKMEKMTNVFNRGGGAAAEQLHQQENLGSHNNLHMIEINDQQIFFKRETI